MQRERHGSRLIGDADRHGRLEHAGLAVEVLARLVVETLARQELELRRELRLRLDVAGLG